STKLTFPEDLAADRKRFEALRTGELASIQYMKRYLHRTGRVIYANLNVSVVKSEDGVPLYVVGIVEDITARHIAEAENARVQAHAEQSQRLQALGTLAGGIAHDFNNILTAIAGNAEFAGKAIGENAQARLHLDRISEAATRATGLVAQILVFGRLQTAERKPTVLQPVIEEALNLLRATLPAKITIKTDLDPTVPAVLADSTQMHQILMNLGTNAAHALTQRGGVIHVSLGVAELSDRQLAGLAAGSYVRLTVSDTGAGMNKEVLAHLFEPFFTTKAQGEGTGLGLSVVHGIVSSYGGAIQVASAPGAGARFDLYFPPAPEGVAIKSAPVAAERRGTGERILVIDDEPAVAEVSQYQLEQNGYRPIVFTNPLSALERFAGEPDSFDCVLTDLSMPGCSGLDVAKAIRELRPKIPVVLASGFLPAEEQEAAAKLGIAAFLPKPYRTAKLLETLARVLSLEPAELPPTH
ncbi:MAG TPA: ATP-binding protein, partial [Candidatus Acidoferrum sp.]|nr:ATP-binding protein [Candidatus Acidoferrum sp.]